jgi:hypothetical protein
MLIQLFKAGSQTKVLYSNVELPPLTLASETCEPPRLDDVVKRLKEMCDIGTGAHSTPVEGTIPCTFEGASFDVTCHFDDNAEARCWIRAERSDGMSDSPPLDDLREIGSVIGGHRVIRYGSPEYRSFMRRKARMPWWQRVRRSAIYGLICAGVVLGGLIATLLIVGENRWPILKMIAGSLFTGAFIFVLMLFGYAKQDQME